MKKLVLVFLGTFLLAQLSIAEVTNSDLDKIRELIMEKKYSEALVAHKKFFEESKLSSGMGGVRVSFALASWAELGQVYPPANAALLKIADDHKITIYAGDGNFNVFQEFDSINSYTGRNKETIEAFKFIANKYPAQVNTFYILVRDLLMEEKQYDLIKTYADDQIYEYEGLRYSREYSLSQLRKKALGTTLESINADFEGKVKKLIDVTEKIGRQDEADEIKNRYAAYFNGNLLKKYH